MKNYDYDEIKQEFIDKYLKEKGTDEVKKRLAIILKEEKTANELAGYFLKLNSKYDFDYKDGRILLEDLAHLCYEQAVAAAMNDGYICECSQCNEQVLKSDMVNIEDADFADLTHDIEICKECAEELASNHEAQRALNKGCKQYHDEK